MPRPPVTPLIHPAKLPYFVLIALMMVHALIYVESYLLPFSTSSKIAERVYNVHHSRGNRPWDYLYYAEAGGHQYEIDGYMFDNLNEGDTFYIHRAYFTRLVQETSFIRGGQVHTFNYSIAKTPLCILFSVLETLGVIVYLMMYQRIAGEPGGRDLFYFLTDLAVVFILFYLH